MIANVYVDGFNLYYGCLKDTPFRWLDLAKLCNLLLPSHQINRIRYFTAPLNLRPDNPFQRHRQQTYLRALETTFNLSIHYGHFLSSIVRMPLAYPQATGPATVAVVKTEEKGTDVNIATYLMLDAGNRECDMAVILTNDSDLATPVQIIRSQFGLQVGIFNPHRNRSWPLVRAANFYRPIRRGPLSASQFPPQLSDEQGIITKPPTW